jgi:hypothetical protein
VHDSPAYKAAGNAKPLIDQTLLQIKQGQLANKQALSGLDDGLINRYASTMGTLANDPDVKAGGINGQAKVTEALTNYSKLQPEAARIAGMFGGVLKNAPTAADGVTKPNLAHLVQSQQMMGADVLGQRSQQGTPTTIDTGAAIQPGVTRPGIEGGGFTAAGDPIAKATPPTVTTNAAGQIVRVAPGGSGASVVPTQAPPGAPAGQPPVNANPNAAQAIAQRGQAEAVTGRVSQALNQANNTVQAQDALSRAKALLESPNAPKTGANFESFKNLKNTMSSLGIDTQGADDMNTLSKNLARYEAARATASGLGGTDAARELAHAGTPNVTLDNKAALSVVNQSLATEKALQSYAKIQSKTSDPQALLKNESDFRNIPHLIEAHEYGMSRSPAEADAYLKAHNISPDQMKQSRAAIKEFDSR